MRLFELTDLAADYIGKLEAEGVRVQPQDVLCIQALSIKACGGGEMLKGRPRCVGGETFWPLTIGAACWFGDFLRFAEERREYAPLTWWAYAYASAHARGVIAAYGEEAVAAIRKWKRTLAATEDELADALAGTMGETIRAGGDDTELHGEDFDREDLAIMLASVCGGDIEKWKWAADLDTAARVLMHSLSVRAAEHGGGGGKDYSAVAGLRELMDYAAQMRERAKTDEA